MSAANLAGVVLAAIILIAVAWPRSKRKKPPRDISAEEMLDELNAAHLAFIEALQACERAGYTITPGEGFNYNVTQEIYDSATQGENQSRV